MQTLRIVFSWVSLFVLAASIGCTNNSTTPAAKAAMLVKGDTAQCGVPASPTGEERLKFVETYMVSLSASLDKERKLLLEEHKFEIRGLVMDAASRDAVFRSPEGPEAKALAQRVGRVLGIGCGVTDEAPADEKLASK